MNSFQQKVVSERIAKEQAFVGAFMQEITAKRNIRTQSIETAIRLTASAAKVAGAEQPEDLTQDVIDTADRIYKYVTQDGQLSDISEEAKIKTLS